MRNPVQLKSGFLVSLHYKCIHVAQSERLRIPESYCVLISGVTIFWDGSNCIIPSIVAMVEPRVWGLTGKARACVSFHHFLALGSGHQAFP